MPMYVQKLPPAAQPSQMAAREKKLEAQVKVLVDALEATVESLETNGFGKQYAIDVGKAALAKARGGTE